MLILAENGYLDILIYVLVIVGGLIANAYREYTKRKEIKRKAENQPSSTWNPPTPVFPEDVFEPEFDYHEPEEEVIETEAKQSYQTIDTVESKIDTIIEEPIPVSSYLEGEAVFEETKSTIISEEVENISEIENQDLTTLKFFETSEKSVKPVIEFDLTKAVIYNEILNPKYF